MLATIASFVAALALGTWFGAMVFFSFVTAPTTFDVLGTDDAGPVVNAVFPKYYQFGLGLGFVSLAGIITNGAATAFGTAHVLALGAAVVALLAVGFARFSLVPKMEAAGADAFAQYHKQSVTLNALTMLAVLVAFAATHV